MGRGRFELPASLDRFALGELTRVLGTCRRARPAPEAVPLTVSAIASSPPSPTFEHFFAQLNARGREKADGFDPSHFEGLRPDEKPRVGELLVGALRAGDGTAANGLLLLDPVGGRRLLDDALAEGTYPERVGLHVATVLWERTRDTRYAGALLPYVRHPLTAARAQALFQLQDAPCTPGMFASLRAAVLEDPDETNRSYAAKKLLACVGAVVRPEDAYAQQRPLMLALRGADAAVRREALATLRQ